MKKILSRTLVVFLIATITSLAFGAIMASADTPSGSGSSATASSEFKLSVPNGSESDDYTPGFNCDKPLQCGTELTFSIIANPKMSNVKYEFLYINIREPHPVSFIDLSHDKNAQTNSYPITFYTSGAYSMCVEVTGTPEGSSVPITRLLNIEFTIDDPAWPTTAEKADVIARECLDAGCKTDFEKALWLHDWILDNCTFDYSSRFCHSEGPLARGTGTEDAYNSAYAMLLERVGIQCKKMTGVSNPWTAVKMDSNWYHIHTSWNDYRHSQTGSDYPDPRHLFFGLDDSIMKLINTSYKNPVSGYEANSLSNNYFIKTGEIRTWSDQYIHPIQKILDEGSGTLSIASLNTNWTKDYKNIINNLIAHQLSNQSWTVNGKIAMLNIGYDSNAELFVATFEPKPQQPQNTQAMHRLYNPNSGEHFYTASEYERDFLISEGWNYEGIGWIAPITSSTPVFRLYNPYAGDHHYTPNEAERDFLIAEKWIDEGIGWYSDDSASVPLYRQYNPNATTGTHNYTTSKYENDMLVLAGWMAEGIGWYGV